MPKTNINDIASEGWRAEVSWRPEDQDGDTPGHVQVATVNQHSPFEFPAEVREYGPEGQELLSEPEPFDGWRVTLDEAGIDRMIEALITARSAAFPHAPGRFKDMGGPPPRRVVTDPCRGCGQSLSLHPLQVAGFWCDGKRPEA